MRRTKDGKQAVGRGRVAGPWLPTGRRNHGNRARQLIRRAFTLTPPAWKGNPRWWHHADRVFSYIIALIAVLAYFWPSFMSFFEILTVFCQ